MDRIPFPGETADARARAIVALQLGRDPRGEIAIAGRCRYGLPGVIRTSPRLADGTPFPTLFYLSCPVAVRSAGALEAEGRMRALEQLLAENPSLREAYQDAHRRYIARRDSLEQLDEPMSAGGMPERVKCLHALYAHEVADANPVGALVREQIDPDACPGPCVAEDADGAPARVAGHPGFAGKKRRR
ncbi:MAG TPA: DUF501 domain-containing protein [Actinomycetota bacterium]|jgi:hypothetical protein